MLGCFLFQIPAGKERAQKNQSPTKRLLKLAKPLAPKRT